MPQFKLLEIVAVLVALAVLVGAVTAAWLMADARACARCRAEERATWQARESKELAAANAMILIESDKALKAERKAEIAITEANDQRRRADALAKAQIKPVADTVAAGLVRLCDPGDPAGKGADPGAEGAATAAASRDNAGERAGFFAAAGDFLSGEAAKADEVTRLLGEAQAYIRTAIATCNAP